MRQALRIISFALQDFLRNIWLSVNTITIITLSILSVNFLIFVTILVNQAITSVENRVNVSIYFKDGVSRDSVEALEKRVEESFSVKFSEIISPEKALENFRERYKDDPDIISALDELDKNPFSFSLLVQAKELSSYSSLTTLLNEPAYTSIIEEKDFTDLESHQRAIERVNDISNKVESVGLIVTIILIFNSLLVVLNTIRLNIYTHRDEIVIMRLVGAGNVMIRGPYVLESIMYAFFSVIAALAIIVPLLKFIQPFLPPLLGQPDFNIFIFYKANWMLYIGWQVILVTALTIFASSIAIRRYIKG